MREDRSPAGRGPVPGDGAPAGPGQREPTLEARLTALDGELARDLRGERPAPGAGRVEAALAELDLEDTNSVLFFGAKAQEQVTAVADGMLEEVRGKDAAGAGETLGRMVATLRGLDVGSLDPTRRTGVLGRILGRGGGTARSYLERYAELRGSVDRITAELMQHKTRLLTDIVRLDRLYAATLDYFRDLEVYIAAGRAKLDELDGRTIPALAAQLEAEGDIVETQRLRDLRSLRDELERRVHDLLLTRQVTMQALPGIRLVQENDKALVAKITSTLANTVPLWRQQLAQAITIGRMGEAGRAVEAASDLTNELLAANASTLRDANALARRQVERGTFDIETVQAANRTLLATIDDSLKIAEEGRQRRREAEAGLEACESELRAVLAAVAPREP